MAGIPVWKMSGAGNDFVVLGPDAIDALGEGLTDWARRISRRRLSVGSDGVLMVVPAPDGRVRVRFLNPDGSEAFCGNGTRCAARYAVLSGMAGPSLTLATAAGPVAAEVADDGRVSLQLRLPHDRGDVDLALQPEPRALRSVDSGTEHVVAVVDDAAAAPLEAWGPWVRGHERFAPHGTNFSVLSPARDVWNLRTWERGVEAETLACGSAALAAAAVVRTLDPQVAEGRAVRLIPTSGMPLDVVFEPGVARLIGDARVVFRGEIDPEAVRF